MSTWWNFFYYFFFLVSVTLTSLNNYFFSGCKVAQRSETINVLSGESVVLRCSWDYKGSLFWIRLIPGKLPEVLGKAFGPKPTDQRIKITEESQAAFLRIARTTTSDTGYYYCMKYTHVVFFSKEIHLSVNGKLNENTIFLNCTAGLKTHWLISFICITMTYFLCCYGLSYRTRIQHCHKYFASWASSWSDCELAVFARFRLQWRHISQPVLS